MMSRSLQLMFAWLLIVAQAAAVLTHPAGLLVCRDPDGTTHVEPTGDDCCLTARDDADHADESAARDTCADGSCEDSLIRFDGLVPTIRPRITLADRPVAPIAWTVGVFDARSFASAEPGLSIESPADPGPPRQTRRALTATVLNL